MRQFLFFVTFVFAMSILVPQVSADEDVPVAILLS